jgi:hypothetical protein
MEQVLFFLCEERRFVRFAFKMKIISRFLWFFWRQLLGSISIETLEVFIEFYEHKVF